MNFNERECVYTWCGCTFSACGKREYQFNK